MQILDARLRGHGLTRLKFPLSQTPFPLPSGEGENFLLHFPLILITPTPTLPRQRGREFDFEIDSTHELFCALCVFAVKTNI